ncbi:MAG: hypothetical protein EHM41_11490 [Chloroflexi bacterium]|nr:MAG: hypothetical protein EHM41_11490 [Chloroflexota bacterium]
MNKKFQILLGLMVMFSLLLAACAPAEEDTGDIEDLGATDIFGEVTEVPAGTPLPGTGAEETEVMETPLATEMVATTEAPEATEMTAEPTEEEMEATPTGAGTPEAGLPGTGIAVGVERLSTLIGAEVVDETNESIGTVDDMVIDLCAEAIHWVSIDGDAEVFGERTNPILVPSDALSWNAATNGENGFFMMTIDPASTEGAPDVSLDEADFNDETWASEWETFWSEQGIQLDMNGEMAACDFTAAGTGADMGGETGTPAATDEDGTGTETPAATETGGTPAAGTATETGGTPAAGATGMNVGISDQGVVLASNLMGMSVEGLNGENIGEVEEILVSLDGAMTGAEDEDETGTAEPTDAATDTGTQETGTPEAGATPTATEGDDSGEEATSTPSTSGDTGGMAAQGGQGAAVHYLVIAAGGFLGLGENNIAVPATAFSYNSANNALVLNIDESLLETAPTIDLDNLDDTAWQSEADTFWMDYEVR